MHDQIELTDIKANGINIRAAVKGSGPLVILVHGWPELWYSWRHQIRPLAKAGYRVVAPDVRGYGGSDKPHAVKAYDMKSLMADVVGIIDYFNEQKAILIGHDWGAPICWNTAALHPLRVAAIAGLSVPYRKRAAVSFPAFWRKLYAGRFFYMQYFQQEGVAEAELELDVRSALRKIYYGLSGDVPNMHHWKNRAPDGGLLAGMPDPDPFPDWLSPADLDYLVAQFQAGGFRGPLNRYRNQERDFELLPQMGVPKVTQPSCFIAGANDLVRNFIPDRDGFANPAEHCTDMRFAEIIKGKGHWIQQEAADEVSAILLDFLRSVSDT